MDKRLEHHFFRSRKLFQKVKQTRIYEELVSQIIEAIKRGELKPHDKLPAEKELAGIFGVSRTTVREALQSLEHYGVISVQQGSQGGAFVKEVEVDSLVSQIIQPLRMTNVTLEELTEARAALEYTILTRLIAGKVTQDSLVRLEENIARAEEHFKGNRSPERLAANFEFHVIIAQMTGNILIVFLLKIILDLIFSFIEEVQPSILMMEDTIMEHKAMLAALRQGDLLLAGDICLRHIKVVSKRIIEKSKRQSMFDLPGTKAAAAPKKEGAGR